MPPVLWSFRRCPYAIRARLALQAAGIDVLLREVALRDKPAALLALSPKGTVPVLQIGDEVIDQSLAIMRWALARRDPEGWVRADERAEVDDWIGLNDGAFKQALDRWKYAPRHPDRTPDAWRDDAVALLPARMEAMLARRRFLLRDTPSLADIALLPFMRQFAAVDAAWFAAQPLPRLRDWLAGLLAMPRFAAAMRVVAPWQPEAADVILVADDNPPR